VSESSDAVTLTVTAFENTAPVADAGADLEVELGGEAVLDATGSSDDDGDGLTYAWTMVERPEGSAAALDDAAAEQPRFTADMLGVYRLELVVNDGLDDSAPDEVEVTAVSGNAAPTAVAGADRVAQIGAAVPLDGSASSDPDGDPLTFTWSFVSRPPGSVALIADPGAATTTFTPDVRGDYVLRLTAGDGSIESQDEVAITALGRSSGGGCDCRSAEPNGSPTWMLLLALALFGLPRRRRAGNG
jgi:MYXO-CTERM domain-containing protein